MGIEQTNDSKKDNSVHKEIQVPYEAQYLVTACIDLHSASQESHTRYLVIGSLAYVCAAGNLYRVPADVDGWYDIENKDALRDSLIRRGYNHTLIRDDDELLPNPLEHFEKGKSVIELRGAVFTHRGIEYPIRLPIPGFSVKKRPLAQLLYTKSLAEPQESDFGGATVLTASQEALWIGLNLTFPLVEAAGEKIEKRQVDLESLSKNLDQEKLNRMLAERPGVYLGKRPIITPDNQTLFKLFTLRMKIRKILSQKS